jgi:hypothetical protein
LSRRHSCLTVGEVDTSASPGCCYSLAIADEVMDSELTSSWHLADITCFHSEEPTYAACHPAWLLGPAELETSYGPIGSLIVMRGRGSLSV